jgi:hypothetical protein
MPSLARNPRSPVTGLLLALMLALLPAAAVQAAQIYERIGPQEMIAILESEGYSNASVDQDGDVELRMQGSVVYFIMAEDRESIQFYCGWEHDGVSLATINEWNRGKKYSRAYLDQQGNPVLELDLDLAGGVTRERITDFIDTAKISLIYFEREVL